MTFDDQVSSTRHFMRELNRLGVTSIIDAGGGCSRTIQTPKRIGSTALPLLTSGSAWMSREDDVKERIARGPYADFAGLLVDY